MNCDFKRKLPIPMEIKQRFPITEELTKLRLERDAIIKAILRGEDVRRILIIGPCSADNEDSVLEYAERLRRLQEKVDQAFLWCRECTLINQELQVQAIKGCCINRIRPKRRMC